MHMTSGNTIKNALIVGERYLHNHQAQTILYRPDERGLVCAVPECDAPIDVRLPHVSRLPIQERLPIDYLLSGRRVFFWLWRHAELVHCPYCQSREIEPRDVCHRGVVDVDETIILVYRTYKCNEIRHPDNSPRIFSTLNEGFRKRLPPALQDTFPAVCPAANEIAGEQGGRLPSRRMSDLVLGFCGAPNRLSNFVRQINRFHFQQYLDMKNLYYYDQAKRHGLLGHGAQLDPAIQAILQATQAVPLFPEYEDPAGWAGYQVTHQWLVGIYGHEILGLDPGFQHAEEPSPSGFSGLVPPPLPPRQQASPFMLGPTRSLDRHMSYLTPTFPPQTQRGPSSAPARGFGAPTGNSAASALVGLLRPLTAPGLGAQPSLDTGRAFHAFGAAAVRAGSAAGPFPDYLPGVSLGTQSAGEAETTRGFPGVSLGQLAAGEVGGSRDPGGFPGVSLANWSGGEGVGGQGQHTGMPQLLEGDRVARAFQGPQLKAEALEERGKRSRTAD